MDQERSRAWIKSNRKTLGVSQYQLANQSGVGRTRLSLFENAHISLRKAEIEALEMALRVALEQRRTDLDQAVSERID